MKIALFGGTGRVGELVMKQALMDGNEVTALVRNSEKVTPHRRLTVVEGNVQDASLIQQTIQGADVVFSALGTDKTTTLTDAMPLILQAMQETRCSRIITIGTAGILNSKVTDGKLRFNGGDSNRKLTFAASEHAKVYEQLEQSTVDWLIVCPTYLPDGPAKGDYIVEEDWLPEGGTQITVGDVAQFAYGQLQFPTYSKVRVGIIDRQ